MSCLLREFPGNQLFVFDGLQREPDGTFRAGISAKGTLGAILHTLRKMRIQMLRAGINTNRALTTLETDAFLLVNRWSEKTIRQG